MNLIKQPLVHFILIGIAIFAIYNLTVSDDTADPLSKTVIVDKESLLKFMQYRSRAFNREDFEKKLNNMSEEELGNMIDDYVLEEVLHREALALGLDKEDYVIRRRLVQKIVFINQGFADSTTELADEDLAAYFEANKKNYYIEPYVTFTHVYFDNEINGKEKARKLAEKKLKELNRNSIPFSDATKHGERYLYNTNYVQHPPGYVASHFGVEFADEIFNADPSDEKWIGPFTSSYGSHAVMVTQNEPGRDPELSEVLQRVKQEAHFDITQKKSEEAMNDVVKAYDVRVEYKQDDHTSSDRAQDSKTAQEN